MKYYFHADTDIFTRRLKHAELLVLTPLSAICVFCTVNIVLNFAASFAKLLLCIIAGCVVFGMIFTFSAVYITEKYKRRHSRYTFFDFLPCGMIFSEYAGEYVRYGEKILLRRVYYIPFEGFESVSRDPKTAPHSITLKGSIRMYLFDSDRLGYHIDENGVLVFDSPELNGRLFTELNQLVIKDRFGNTKALEKSVNAYYEQWKNIPEKKPFDISEHISIVRKKKLRTSNPALEAPSYSRKWGP